MSIAVIGFGAVGQEIVNRSFKACGREVAYIVVRESRLQEVQARLSHAKAVTSLPPDATIAIECAGHEALKTHVVSALERGIECAVLSVGALSEPGLPEALEAAANQGKSQLHLLAGAIGGIDAISAAKHAGLDRVVYTGRKPPSAWGKPELSQTTVIFEGSAREAALTYPKNANVAATISLAGIGLDNTTARLIADPSVTENVHEIELFGAFGQMRLEMRGKPLASNPKTSALTVLSALRFLSNRFARVTI